MAKRTASEIFAAARQAGLSVPAAITATAVALAESGGDDRALGDTTITGGGWGPSVGVWQIRTRTEQYGTGGDRDQLALQGNLARQAQAMRSINKFLGQAQQAAGGTPGAGGVQQLGLADVGVGDTAARALESARDLAIKIGAAGLGVALLGVGLVVAVRSRVMAGQNEVKRAFGGGGGG